MLVPTEGMGAETVASVNESGGFVWRLLEKDRSFGELTDALMNEYGISKAQAEADLREFLEIIESYIDI